MRINFSGDAVSQISAEIPYIAPVIDVVAWTMVFDSLWKTFNPRFQGILESLRRHRNLIDQEANTINISEARSWRTEHLNNFKQWRAEHAIIIKTMQREQLKVQIREAVLWLDAKEQQENVLGRLSRATNNPEKHWALTERNIQFWLGQDPEPRILWLYGKLGAGEYYN